ncbi:hypothetical protein B0T26DRAFT_716386 [Lasiosphaeria miniovina]|uniref:DUF155 domain-containing protein n=1 Tax=Lasiosphaeria miniovina TaxID=1954250 RepID=A0AA40ACD0_9PEZI|nr:uncharacterized protein B0T26DRAFT_716386 [Lasiosphaeria miniovina]KAK0713098.1 hypothetical protein B0T26DRAFT_716386 [Lasiosphaeria miniovina]
MRLVRGRIVSNGTAMKSFLPRLGPIPPRSSICSTSTALSRPQLRQRQFHRTPPVRLPHRRTFFTSNALLQQDGTESVRSGSQTVGRRNGSETDANANANGHGNDEKSAAQKKRKPPLKSSLHRLAIVAQKGVPGKPLSAPPSDAPVAVTDGSSTISAVCIAESFDMDRVASILAHHGFSLDPDNTGFEVHEVVHARGLNQGDIFVFPSGTVVTWALPPDIVNTLATKHLLPAAGSPFVAEKEVEDLDFIVDPKEEQSRVSGDVVVLGTQREVVAGDRLDTTLAKIAFSSGLARSTKLAVLEGSLTRYLESTRHIPDRLSQGLKAPLSRGLILQKTGELLNLRSQLNHYNDLTDALPDIFWDTEEKLETYYSKIGKALDVGVRIKTLNDKMTYAQQVVSVAQDVLDISEKMSSERHSTRLEWIIIVLIAIEVGFELRRLYIEKEDTFQHELLAELRAMRAEMNQSTRVATSPR